MSKAHLRLFVLIAAAYAVGLVSAIWLDWQLAAIVAANFFFVVYLANALTSLDTLSETKLKALGVSSDAPAFAIYLITLSTVATALIALFIIVNADIRPSLGWLIVALLSVPLGWATIHMMAAVHYANLYWRRGRDGQPLKELVFPGDREPDGWDFVYFAFVIGMAAQTSDVAICGPGIRRFALAHSIAAYFFNAVLVAAAVNVAVAGN